MPSFEDEFVPTFDGLKPTAGERFEALDAAGREPGRNSSTIGRDPNSSGAAARLLIRSPAEIMVSPTERVALKALAPTASVGASARIAARPMAGPGVSARQDALANVFR